MHILYGDGINRKGRKSYEREKRKYYQKIVSLRKTKELNFGIAEIFFEGIEK